MKNKNTAEKYYGLMLIIISITTSFLFLLLLSLLLGFDRSDNAVRAYLSLYIIFFLIVGITLVYYICQYVYYKRVKLTEVQEVKLEGIDTCFRMIGFNIKVNVGIFEEIKEVTTKHVFFVGEISANKVDDFAGKIAKVGYNKKRDEWIVIDVLK